MYKFQNKCSYFVLHFFICQLMATCLACLCPFISFIIINFTFSKFMLMPTSIFLPSTCSDSTTKLCCVEEEMMHLLVNVDDATLSMHCRCKKEGQTDIQMDRQTAWQTYRHRKPERQRHTNRQKEGRRNAGRWATGEGEEGRTDRWIDKWMDRNRKVGKRKEGEYSVSGIWLVREQSKLYRAANL